MSPEEENLCKGIMCPEDNLVNPSILLQSSMDPRLFNFSYHSDRICRLLQEYVNPKKGFPVVWLIYNVLKMSLLLIKATKWLTKQTTPISWLNLTRSIPIAAMYCIQDSSKQRKLWSASKSFIIMQKPVRSSEWHMPFCWFRPNIGNKLNEENKGQAHNKTFKKVRANSENKDQLTLSVLCTAYAHTSSEIIHTVL